VLHLTWDILYVAKTEILGSLTFLYPSESFKRSPWGEVGSLWGSGGWYSGIVVLCLIRAWIDHNNIIKFRYWRFQSWSINDCIVSTLGSIAFMKSVLWNPLRQKSYTISDIISIETFGDSTRTGRRFCRSRPLTFPLNHSPMAQFVRICLSRVGGAFLSSTGQGPRGSVSVRF
jgi:hypothetical protein